MGLFGSDECLKQEIRDLKSLNRSLECLTDSLLYAQDPRRCQRCLDNYATDLKLYITVLEGELGSERTESAKKKTEALRALK